MGEGVQVIATTISGSIADWGKVERIVPLFRNHGREDVDLHSADSHAEARRLTRDLVRDGGRTLISAGGSGTFNAVLEGCVDSGIGLGEITLGFLRKGSADLIGKVLKMPDDIEEAVAVFARSLESGCTVPCDVIEASSPESDEAPRRFVGYGGAELFGRIPHYTENRFIKYYKGVLSQLFGDMGPFFTGATLSTLEKMLRRAGRRRRSWRISVDGEEAARGPYQAMIIVNGYLGPNLPWAEGVPLGSGDFRLFCLRDLGFHRLPGQFRHAWDASVLEEPARWGFESYKVGRELRLAPEDGGRFPVNVDGSTMDCAGEAVLRIVDRIRLISRD
jgi:diacylglycerol kinase family enzyme